MIEAVSIHKSYPTPDGGLQVLRDVNLSLTRGRSAAIMGPSGSGKSTLLSVLGTLESPTSGQVRINGVDPFTLSVNELAPFRNRQIGFVFQDHHLLPQCSVLENVLLPTLAGERRGDALETARRLCDRVGLARRLDHRPAELSGGERQRTALARALVNHPAVLLADEPTGNLDRSNAESVADLLCELQRDQNVTLVVVTHSRSVADRFESIFEMNEGGLAPV